MNFITKLLRSNNILSLLGNGLAAVFGFLSFALLARSLSKEDFGNWIIFITIYIFVELVRVGFLQTPLVKFTAGANEEEKNKVLGASWIFALPLTVGFILINVVVSLIGTSFITNAGVKVFFNWFPLIFICSLPNNFSAWVLQADSQFKKILYIRLVSLVVFIGLITANFFLNQGLSFIIISYTVATVSSSMLCVVCGWTRILTIKHATFTYVKKLYHFGKYSTGTMIGANLLRSSDTLLIGAMIGPEAVAMYSIPLKLFEIVEIPLRSFVATSLPVFSKLVNENNKIALKSYFEKTAGTYSIAIIPLVLFSFFFADYLVMFLGGEEYMASANILRIFALLSVFMPFDRYTGVTLDVLHKPNINFMKVLLMLIVNVAGDYIVLYFFGTLISVAMVSIITFVSGVVLGLFFLKKDIDISIRQTFISGIAGIKEMIGRFYKVPGTVVK